MILFEIPFSFRFYYFALINLIPMLLLVIVEGYRSYKNLRRSNIFNVKNDKRTTQIDNENKEGSFLSNNNDKANGNYYICSLSNFRSQDIQKLKNYSHYDKIQIQNGNLRIALDYGKEKTPTFVIFKTKFTDREHNSKRTKGYNIWLEYNFLKPILAIEIFFHIDYAQLCQLKQEFLGLKNNLTTEFLRSEGKAKSHKKMFILSFLFWIVGIILGVEFNMHSSLPDFIQISIITMYTINILWFYYCIGIYMKNPNKKAEIIFKIVCILQIFSIIDIYFLLI